MSLVERRFSTRGYELDWRGVVSPATLLRYMEHLRWESLDVETLGLDRLFAEEHSMVVAAQRLQVETELGRGVALVGELDIGQVGRSSLEFLHRFYRASDGRTIARGSVIVVHLSRGGQPVALPDEIAAGARGMAGQARSAGPTVLAPEPPREPPPPNAWRHALRVRPSDEDLLRHVNHVSYLTYVEDARQLCALAAGYGAPGLGGGQLRRLAIEYLQQAVQGEALVVDTWPMERSPLVLGFILHRENEVRPVCRAAVELAPGPQGM